MFSSSLLRATCACMFFGILSTAAPGQSTPELDLSQLKKGDKLEVQNAGAWVPGEFHEPNTKHTIQAIYSPFESPVTVPVAHIRPATSRTWTDATGKFKVEGALLRADRDGVVIRRDDGKEITLPASRLQKADREYVATFPNLASKFPTDEEKKAAAPQEPRVAISETNLGREPSCVPRDSVIASREPGIRGDPSPGNATLPGHICAGDRSFQRRSHSRPVQPRGRADRHFWRR
jgi:hypothetical protein